MNNLIPFPAGQTHGPFNQPGERLYLHREGTDAMRPTLNQGDWVVWTPLDGRPIGDMLYLVEMDRMDGAGAARMVKRIQCFAGMRFRIISDDPAYPPYDVTYFNWPEDFRIVGRVVGIMKRV